MPTARKRGDQKTKFVCTLRVRGDRKRRCGDSFQLGTELSQINRWSSIEIMVAVQPLVFKGFGTRRASTIKTNFSLFAHQGANSLAH